MKHQPTKDSLLKALLDDFVREFPESDRLTRLELYTRLNMLSIDDLSLLASQLTGSKQAKRME